MAIRNMLLAACALAALLAGAAHGQSANIVINGVALTDEEIVDYQVWVPDGRYWYDPVSGLWGAEGGPSVGYIDPELPLGGELASNASGSGSGVFINGREIHSIEVMRLMDIFGGPIQQGRYWLGADGVGGVEGFAASFSLTEQEPQQEQGSGQVFEDDVADFCAEVGGCPW